MPTEEDMPVRKASGRKKYGSGASSKVRRAMHERKSGTLRSGRSGKKVKSRKQAIAIGLSEAEEAQQRLAEQRAQEGRIGRAHRA